MYEVERFNMTCEGMLEFTTYATERIMSLAHVALFHSDKSEGSDAEVALENLAVNLAELGLIKYLTELAGITIDHIGTPSINQAQPSLPKKQNPPALTIEGKPRKKSGPKPYSEMTEAEVREAKSIRLRRVYQRESQ